MARVSSAPLLVLAVAVAACILAGTPSPASAQSCTGANITLHEGQQQVINTTTTTDREGKDRLKFTDLFMVGEEGFQGVRLDVNGTDGTQHTAWFPVKDQCFPPDKQWQRVSVTAKINTDVNTLDFILNDGSSRICTMSDAPAGLHSLSVVAYGPSQWSSGMPRSSCESRNGNSEDDECAFENLNTCSTPPTTTTAAPETATTPWTPKSAAGLSRKMIMIIAAASAVLLVVVVVVVVVVHCWRKSGTSHATTSILQASQPNNQPETTQNDIYEPFDKYASNANFSTNQEPEVIQNDLYEPFDKYASNANFSTNQEPEVIQNDLYEPFDKYASNANFSTNQEPEVIANDLYESVDGYACNLNLPGNR